MCIYLNKIEKNIADKDIKVFKIAYFVYKDAYCSPIHYARYQRNEVMKAPIGVQPSYFLEGMSETTTGLYSYIPDIKYMVRGNALIIGNILGNTSMYNLMDSYIATFIIPKGSEYMMDNSVCISNMLIYTGHYIKIAKESNCKRIFEDFLKDENNFKLN